MTGPGRHRLVLDLQGAQDPRNGDRGIGRAVAELAAALARIPGAVAAALLNPLLPVPRHLPEELLESPLLAWNTASAVAAARRDGPVAYHLMSPFEMGTPAPVAVPAHAVAEDVALVVTLHDLIPLREPARLLVGETGRRYRSRLELVRGSDLLLCVSRHTRDEAVELLGVPPARCAVIGGGAAGRFHPPAPGDDPDAVLRRHLPQIGAAHVLCVSGGDERKNTPALITAWGRLPRRLRDRHQLVVSCELDPGIGADWRATAASAGLGPGELLLTGFVPDEVLVALYQRASLVVMPSLAEGFGLPVAEAVACGRPVVTSSTGALPELLDLPEGTFDPRDRDAMASTIARALDDTAYRERLLAAGRRAAPRLRWDAVAARTVEALGSLPAPRAAARPPRRRRLRVALVGPLPPVRSGVADYNGHLCEELGRRVDLDVLSSVEVQQRPLAGADRPYRHLAAEALGRGLDPFGYDAVVHTLGNSQHHVVSAGLARRFPGVLWLHDVRLAALHRDEAVLRHPGGAPAWMRERLVEQYGARLGTLDGAAVLDRAWQHAHGVFLSRDLVRRSRAVLVNSAFAERVLRLDQGPDAGPLRITRLPFGIRRPPAADVARDLEPPLVASFGSLDSIKAPERILEAVAAVADRVPVRLAFVGPVGGIDLPALEGLASRLGIAGSVVRTGPVEEGDWWRWLRRASVAVQLRRMTNAETSAAVADALAVGTPVVTNIIGAEHEYPDGAAVVIANDLCAGELEDALLRLLTDEAVRRRHAEAGLAHAAGAGFDVLADRLTGALEGIVSGALAG